MKKRLLKLQPVKIKTVHKYGTGLKMQSVPETDPTTVTYGTVSTIIFGI